MKKQIFIILLPIILGLSFIGSLWVQKHFNDQVLTTDVDINIYLHAGELALKQMDPYQPYEIGKSLVYPPITLLVFAPLSSLTIAKEIWATINIVCLLSILSIMLRIIPKKISALGMVWVTAWALLFPPFLEQIIIGQVNTLVLLGIVLFILGVANPRYKWIGDFGLALAISIKITPLFLLAYPLFTRDWYRCLRVSAYLLSMALISIICFGITPWIGFLRILPKLAQGYPATMNQALAPTVAWLATTFSAEVNASLIGIIFSILVLLLWIATVILRANHANSTAILSFGIISMTVGSSLIWYHHLVFLMVPILFLISSTDRSTNIGKEVFFLTLTGTILIQIDRIYEAVFLLPPLASIVGYLFIFLAAFLSLFIALKARTTQPVSADVHSPLSQKII